MKMRKRSWVAAGLTAAGLAFLCFSAGLFAESVFLKSGQKVEGKILERTDTYVRIELADATSVTYFAEEIEKVEIQPAAPVITEKKASASSYMNKQYGFRLQDPPGWDKQEDITTPFGTPALVFYSKGEEVYPAIGVTQDSTVRFRDVAKVMDFTRKMLDPLETAEVTILEEPSETTLGGMPATRMKFAYPKKYKGERVLAVWHQVMKGQTVFTISLTDIESRFPENESVLNAMRESFKFLARGASETREQDAALFRAAADGDREKILEALSEGASVSSQDNDERASALMLAVIGGHRDAVELLLSKGADINAKDKKGTTALIYAVALGRKDMVELLLKFSPALKMKDSRGYTALMTAEEPGGKRDSEIIKLLKDHGEGI